MSFNAICRLCLVTDGRFFSILNTPLQDVFMKLTSIAITGEEIKPATVCFMCYTYLRRCAVLSQKALRADKILNGFIHTNVLITPQAVHQIDRQSYSLTHTLSVSPIEHINVDGPTNFPTENEMKQDLDDLPVKNELDFPTENEMKQDLDDLPVKNELVDETKKYDDTQSDNHNSCPHTSDSEDDVPLKNISVKKQLQKSEVRRKKKINVPRKNKEECISDYAREIILTKEEQIAELKERAKSLNYLNSPLKCTLCFKGFVDSTAFFHHMEKHSEGRGAHECGVCRARYGSPRQLRAHRAAAHARRYACRRCAAVARTANQARDHEKWHRGHTYECKLCGQKFRKPTSHLTHMRKRHPTEQACVLCGDSFATTHGLLMHRSKTHSRDQPIENTDEPASKRFCQECDVQFVSLDAWKRHMLTSTKHMKDSENSSRCLICDTSFSTTSELSSHLKGHERALKASRAAPVPVGTVTELPCVEVACDQCGARFVNRSKLQAHIKRIHLGLKYNKNIVCEVCGKNCTSNASLKYHQRTHTGERPYQCTTCSKRFSDNNQLRIHIRTHTGERPYCCAACGKRFSQKPALNRHYRVHTGVKPYVCQYCSKTFTQSNSLKLHVKTVHLKIGGKRNRAPQDSEDVETGNPVTEFIPQ